MNPKVTPFFRITIIFLFLGMFTLSACKENSIYKPSYSKPIAQKKTLILGVANIAFYEANDLIAQYLNKRLRNVQLKTIARSNYETYLNKLGQKAYDITLINGLEALKAQKNGYQIVAKFESDSDYYAVLFANKNSNIHRIKDLKEKQFALSGKGSIVGELAPLVFLQKNGLNVYHDLELMYFPSFETNILNVYLDKCDAGVSGATSWNRYIESHPEILKKLEVKWKTPPLINFALIMKKGIDSKTTAEITNLLLNMHKDEDGRLALKAIETTKLIKANSNTYAPMMKLQNEFDQLPK